MHIVTRRLGGETLLDYEVSTTPFPLQASPADVTQPLTSASLVVIASNQNSHAAAISEVQISFDIAPTSDPDDATYLTSIGSGITFQVLGDPDQTIWKLADDGAGTFTAISVASGGVPVESQGITFVISGVQPNRSVGSFDLTITETPYKAAQSSQAVELSKFPPAFFLTNFRSDVTSVGQGGSTTLRWDASSGAKLTILYATGQQVVTGLSSWPTPALTSDTAFLLQASIGDVALATLSLTVQVSQPILDLTSLTVEQTSTLKGALNAISTLSVGGATTLSGPMSVTGAATLSNGATVTGGVSASGAISGSSVSALGAVSAATVAATNGSLSIANWQFTLDSGGNLILTNPAGANVTFFASGGVNLNSATVVTSGATVWISSDNGWLNGSGKFPSYGADGFNAGTYWQNGPPDGDSVLNITLSNPG